MAQLKLVRSAPLNSRTPFPNDVEPNSLYSNVTNFSGAGFTNGGATTISGNTITRLVADSLGFINTPPYSVSGFTFSVINMDASNVTARARVRFYANDGTGGAPGTYIAGYTFNAMSFTAGNVGTYSATVTPFTVNTPAIWAGITFDDNIGTSGATASELNNLGPGIFTPVDRGTSEDSYYLTNSAGSFASNNPAGTFGNFGGAPLADFGWEFVMSVALPVTLTNFDVQRNGTANNLSWNTSQEFNTNYFAIERSNDGYSFSKIGTVRAAGNSSTGQNYQYTDASPVKGVNYYRILVTNKDNSGKYSMVRMVRNSGSADISMYPNPVADVLKVVITADKAESIVISITDMNGKQVHSNRQNVNQGSNTLSINTTNFAKGNYSIKINLSDDHIIQKFTKK